MIKFDPLIYRKWAMASRNTFDIPPIREFVLKYLADSKASVDPFARDCLLATVTNDLNPTTAAEYHMEAAEFLALMAKHERQFDLCLFDPPYSVRQISECYSSVGLKPTQRDTQGFLWRETRDALLGVLAKNATVLSFGWNTVGMGKGRGFEIVEILQVCHGGMHNDTLCMAERSIATDE